jgi:hypothetical protein
MQQIAQSCTKLTSLKIFGNNKLRLNSLLALKRLQKIEFEECSSFTYEGIIQKHFLGSDIRHFAGVNTFL